MHIYLVFSERTEKKKEEKTDGPARTRRLGERAVLGAEARVSRRHEGSAQVPVLLSPCTDHLSPHHHPQATGGPQQPAPRSLQATTTTTTSPCHRMPRTPLSYSSAPRRGWGVVVVGIRARAWPTAAAYGLCALPWHPGGVAYGRPRARGAARGEARLRLTVNSFARSIVSSPAAARGGH